MQDAKKLIRVHFDNSENHCPLCEEDLGVFFGGKHSSAHGQISEWMRKQEPCRVYLGYDGKFYPQYRIIDVKIHSQD